MTETAKRFNSFLSRIVLCASMFLSVSLPLFLYFSTVLFADTEEEAHEAYITIILLLIMSAIISALVYRHIHKSGNSREITALTWACLCPFITFTLALFIISVIQNLN